MGHILDGWRGWSLCGVRQAEAAYQTYHKVPTFCARTFSKVESGSWMLELGSLES
jgi:hypothetical protein